MKSYLIKAYSNYITHTQTTKFESHHHRSYRRTPIKSVFAYYWTCDTTRHHREHHPPLPSFFSLIDLLTTASMDLDLEIDLDLFIDRQIFIVYGDQLHIAHCTLPPHSRVSLILYPNKY